VTAFIVFAVIAVMALILAAMLALDRSLGGRTVQRSLLSARHGGGDNANVDYAVIDRHGTQNNFYGRI